MRIVRVGVDDVIQFWLIPIGADFVISSPVTQALVSHCEQWITKFSLLLHDLASSELQELYSYMASSSTNLRKNPRTLDELAHIVNLQKSLESEQADVEGRFEPLRHMFRVLEKVCGLLVCLWRSVARGRLGTSLLIQG
jgi:hypothetical protein